MFSQIWFNINMSVGGEPLPGAAPVDVVKPKEPVAIGVGVATPGEPKVGIEQVKKELIDPRTISKKIDPEGRTETARAILESRANARSTSEDISQREQRVQQIAELTSSSYQQERQKANELTQRLENVVVKVKKLAGVGDAQASGLQAEIDAVKSERDALYAETWATEKELEGLKQKQTEIPNPRQLLEAYYERMSTQPLSNEQKRELLKPDVLASLSTEEYIALWKRLNPHFLSHVTRQGFRDHNGMFYHSAGMQDFHNGFVGVMEDEGLLRPPMAIRELKTRDEAAVKEWLGDWVLGQEDEEQARQKLDSLLHFHLASAPKYPDKTAVHFAAQLVADDYYGGESSNEVFFIYPSDVLASQHAFAFNGWEKDFTHPQSETKWNDVFIWPDTVDNPGIPIDTGMVFLPEHTPVDSETGSKYASEVQVVDGQEKRVMVEDAALVGSFVEWGKKLNEESPLRQAFNAMKDERHYYRQQELREDCFAAFVQELQGLGFKTDASAALANKLMGDMYYRESYDDEVLQHVIKESGAQWKRAENTIPAKDYWERYFTQHPDLRPKHIQYYDGDPTTAVLAFQRQNGIGKADTSGAEGQLLGFDDNHVTEMQNDPRSNIGYDELVATADRIIKERYASATVPVAAPAE